MSSKRKDYLSWDEYFMSIVKLSAMRSKDRSVDPVKDKLASKLEKEFNRKGGHAYSESYDDEDELVTNVRL